MQLIAVCGEGTAVAPPAVMAVAYGRGISSTSIAHEDFEVCLDQRPRARDERTHFSGGLLAHWRRMDVDPFVECTATHVDDWGGSNFWRRRRQQR